MKCYVYLKKINKKVALRESVLTGIPLIFLIINIRDLN